VIGIGNPDRGDDGVGPLIVEKLRTRLPDEVETIVHSGEATSLLGRIDDACVAILIDACSSSALAGTVRRIDANGEALPDLEFGLSTHGFGLASAIELGRVLGQLPPRCIVFAVEAGGFDAGSGMSANVMAAIDAVVEAICDEVMQDA
ncbi:MAG: hydrogenase maturation protease, partial [Hyphomicrobiales bacterium]|nr:hydrogenase maturation protease [Hyphomicrobiales bacterium]